MRIFLLLLLCGLINPAFAQEAAEPDALPTEIQGFKVETLESEIAEDDVLRTYYGSLKTTSAQQQFLEAYVSEKIQASQRKLLGATDTQPVETPTESLQPATIDQLDPRKGGKMGADWWQKLTPEQRKTYLADQQKNQPGKIIAQKRLRTDMPVLVQRLPGESQRQLAQLRNWLIQESGQ